MTQRDEEDPDPDEDPEDQPPGPSGAAPTPTVGAGGREFEYRTEALSETEVSDGTMVAKLNQASADGWDLVDVISAGPQRVLLQRRPKRPSRESRPVGFLRPG